VNHKGDKEYWQLVWDNFKAGDRQAFETIYNEFVDVLFAYGSKITSNKALLEDAIQDVFIDVYTYGKSLRHPELLEFYLFKVLKRNLIHKLKENSRFDHSTEVQDHFDLKFPVEFIEQEKQELEKQCKLLQLEIQNLDARKRELLFLKFNSGLTYAEIGQLLNMKPDTAKKQVRRIIKYFHKHLSERIIELFILCYTT
jgi:RNA polymerase sigma factor (sigma-70 family)